MNLFKNRSGAIKGAMVILTLAFVIASVSYIIPGLADHTSTVTITPSQLKCGDEVTFTVVVTNNGPDKVREVRLLDGSYGGDHYYDNIPPHENYQCGAAPTGWVLYDKHPTFPYCQYEALTPDDFLEGGESETFTFSAKVTAECDYNWAVETYDIHLAWDSHEPPITVDCTPPETTKWYEGPQKPQDNIYPKWISSETWVHLDATDDFPDPEKHDTGIKETWYKNVIVDEALCWDSFLCYIEGQKYIGDGWLPYSGPFQKPDQSCHLIMYYSIDGVGNEEYPKWQCVFVDNTPPIGNKEVGKPSEPGEGFTWVTKNTPITLTCTDQPPHPVDQEDVCFKVSYDDEDTTAVTERYCKEYEGVMKEGWCCVDAEDPFDLYFLEDSIHDLEFYCVDHLGNKEIPHKVQWYRVDTEPPETTKTYIPDAYVDPGSGLEYIDTAHEIKLEAEDGGDICVIGLDEIRYRVSGPIGDMFCENCQNWMSMLRPDMGPWNTYTTPFTIQEESCHVIEFSSVDLLENEEEIQWQCVFVDKTPPEVDKKFIGPSYTDGDSEWIDGVTEIELVVTDPEPHPSGVAKVEYRVTLVDDYYCWGELDCEKAVGSGDFSPYIETIKGLDESCHLIEVRAVDNVGKEAEHKQCVFVDKTPPEIDKVVGTPKLEGDDNFDWWVTKNTPITLKCQDVEPHPSNDVTIYWSYTVDGGAPIEGSHNGESYDLYFQEDSVHVLEFWCEDAVEKESIHDIETFKVDTEPPETTKTYIPDAYVDPGSGLEYIDTAHEIKLEAEDGGDICVIGLDEIRYRVSGPIGDMFCENCQNWMSMLRPDMGPWNTYTTPFTIQEESCHVIEFSSVDLLENEEEIQWQCVFVDKTPPETTKTYDGPQWPRDCNPHCDGPKWISSETLVILDANDPEPHPSGVAATYWRNEIVSDTYCEIPENCQPIHTHEDTGWTLYEDPFNKPEESCHMIEYYSVDNVGKKEAVKAQCVFVDNTGPDPVKTIGEPKDMWTPGENNDTKSYYYPEETELCWTLPEEECKEADSETCIECWEATTLTPIIMDCEDPDPHPVGEKKICYKVDVDGEDKTKRYCMEYGGWYNWKSGYCCRWLGPEDENENHDNCEFYHYRDRCDEVQEIECYNKRKLFYFLEETEHNLKYYCIDKLKNEGLEDEEKFKIEGTKFEIPLFKKWNLISVPFTLLNDDPTVVFDKIYFDGEQIPYEEIGDYIDSVWAYDPEGDMCGDEWCVWTPGEAPDDLKIWPGWGYWVMVYDKPVEECPHGGWCFHHIHNEEPLWMVIGGSLFSPAELPPSRQLQEGWNLIGYYGTKWEEYDQGDFDFMCGDQYGGWWKHGIPEKYLYGDQAYCALNSLIDTQVGYPRWSSLWSYINCGNHNTNWLGLNACINPSSYMAQDRMYAGRGYWLELDVEDVYAPATTCIWNDDFECVWTGGGIFI